MRRSRGGTIGQQQQQQEQEQQDYGLQMQPTQSESESESFSEEPDSDLVSQSDSDSESMGLSFPTGYMLPTSPKMKKKAPQAAGETTHEEQRLVMLAKHPHATDATVAEALRQQQHQTAKKKKQRQLDKQNSDTGEAWKERRRQALNSFGANLRSPQVDQAWVNDQQSQSKSAQYQNQHQHQQPPPKSSFLASLFSKLFPSSQDDFSDCAASRQSISLSSEKTPKISNVDESARDKRIRRETGQLTHQDRLNMGCKRLASTRNGLIILSLLIVLFLAIIVTIAAAMVSNKNNQAGIANSNGMSTIIPRSPINMEDTVSPSPSPAPSSSEDSSPIGTPAPTHSHHPSLRPTTPPKRDPSKPPTRPPSFAPTRDPTPAPTALPSVAPTTSSPSATPSDSSAPSFAPTPTPFVDTLLQALGEPLQGSQADQRFGHSVALSENGRILAVGAPFATIEGKSQAGMVQVYVWRSNSNSWVTRGPALVGRNAQDQLGSSLSLSHDGSVLVASEPTFQGQAGDRSGNVRAFVYGPANRYEPLGPELEGEAATDHFGVSIALSANGRRLAVGAPYHDNGGDGSRNVSGQVTILEFVDNAWKIMGTPLAGSHHLDWFGWKVDLSDDGSILAVGAPRNLQYGGYVNCYQWNENENDWSPFGEPILNQIEPLRYDDNFGHTLRLSGNNRIAIAAPGKNGLALDAGQVTVYELDDNDKKGEWKLLGTAITSDAPGEGDQLGLAVDLQGDVLVVGTPGKNNRGQVDFYKYNNSGSGQWERHPHPLQGVEGSNFGFSVHYTASTSSLAVGSAVTSDENTGTVNVYQQS